MSNENWTNEKEFSSFEEAENFKNLLIHSPEGAIMEYKIKRYKNVFIIKSRIHPILVDAVKEIDEKIKKIKR